MAHIDIVENDTEDGAAHILDGLLDTLQHGFWKATVLHHDDGEVHFAGKHGGVAHAEDRRGIEEDYVEPAFDFLDKVEHALGIENAYGIARDFAAGHEEEIFGLGEVDDILEGDVGGEVVAETGLVGHAENAVLRGAAKVGIDYQSGVAAFGKGVGKVVEGGGFALAGAAADECDGACGGGFAVELNVRAHDPVGLGIGVVIAGADEQADVLGNDGEHGNAEKGFQFLHRFHAGVEVFDEEGEADSEADSNDHAKDHVEKNAGMGGKFRRLGALPDDSWILRHGALHGLGGEPHFGGLEDALGIYVIVLGFVVTSRAGF